jgi:hypothetical protein
MLIGITRITLGRIGLLNIPVTYGWTPTGLAERICLYSYLLWALVTGIALIRSSAIAVMDVEGPEGELLASGGNAETLAGAGAATRGRSDRPSEMQVRTTSSRRSPPNPRG